MAWKRVLKADPTEWLLEPVDPSGRFWALQDLEDKGLDHPKLKEAQDALMASAARA